MNRLNNNSVLQIFASNADYQHHKKHYTFRLKNPLYASIKRMPPWQIIGLSVDGIENVDLIRIEDGSTINVFNILGNPSGMPGLSTVETSTGVFNIIYNPLLQFATALTPIGEYEAVITATAGTYYTERFRIVQDVSTFVKLEWWHNVDFPVSDGVIEYASGFKNHIYVRGDLGKPQYEMTDIVDTRDGVVFPIHQIWKKVNFLDILCTEAIADVITKIGLHHNKEVTYNGETYRILYFVPQTPDWLEEGDLGNIECRLELGFVSQLTGDAANLAEYNDDFGDDFTNP